MRREGTSEAAPEAVRQAVGGLSKRVWGGYCRLQTPLKLALAVRGTVAGHRLGALEDGGGGVPPPAPLTPPRPQRSAGAPGLLKDEPLEEEDQALDVEALLHLATPEQKALLSQVDRELRAAKEQALQVVQGRAGGGAALSSAKVSAPVPPPPAQRCAPPRAAKGPGVDIIVTTLPRWGWGWGGGGLLSQEAVMTE